MAKAIKERASSRNALKHTLQLLMISKDSMTLKPRVISTRDVSMLLLNLNIQKDKRLHSKDSVSVKKRC